MNDFSHEKGIDVCGDCTMHSVIVQGQCNKSLLIAKASMRTGAIAYPSCQPMTSVCKAGGEEAIWLARLPPLLAVVV